MNVNDQVSKGLTSTLSDGEENLNDEKYGEDGISESE